MERVKIKETNLQFVNPLSERYETNQIVIHHLGSVKDIDASAAQVHDIHINTGYSGIGYHFIVRKNGIIERGRPIYAVGAHAYGENWHTIGINVSGDFNAAEPTTAQIESTAMLIANLCEDYTIPTDRQHIVGHFEINETNCPGKNLTARLDEIVGKANWYRYGAIKPDVVNKSAKPKDTVLSEHFDASEFWCRGQDQKTCKCNHSLKVQAELIEMLEELRKLCGNRPLYINSGYRCPEHNASIGGAANSQHCLGTAADVARPDGITFDEFVACVEKLPFDGIGIYERVILFTSILEMAVFALVIGGKNFVI